VGGVEEFSSAGTFLSQFAVTGLRYGIAIDANGDIWVSEYYADCVVEFSPMGSELGSFGGYGTGEGLFNIGPAGIVIEQRSIHVDGGELDARDQESGEGVALQSASVAMHIIGIKQKRRYSLSA
jgi:hypothetical protein